MVESDIKKVRRRYQNLNGGSGVRDYQLGDQFIRVWFDEKETFYEYDHAEPGKQHVDEMKRRAEAGRGLATYINQYVKYNYARKS